MNLLHKMGTEISVRKWLKNPEQPRKLIDDHWYPGHRDDPRSDEPFSREEIIVKAECVGLNLSTIIGLTEEERPGGS